MLLQVIAAAAGVALLRAAGTLSARALGAAVLVMPATLVVGALALQHGVDHSDDIMLFLIVLLVVTPLLACTFAAALARTLLRVSALSAWIRAWVGWYIGAVLAFMVGDLARPIAPSPFWYYAAALIVPATYAAIGAVTALPPRRA